VPVPMSLAKLQPQTISIGIVVTDLSSQKALEEKLRQAKNGLEEQVAERTKELRDSEARLFGILEHSAADLKAMRRLNEIGAHCAKAGHDVPGCLREVLNVSIEISNADKGIVQLLDPESGVLTIATQSGFDEPFLKFFANVEDGESVWRAAKDSQQRVIVEDVLKSEIFRGKPKLEILTNADVRAVQS